MSTHVYIKIQPIRRALESFGAFWLGGGYSVSARMDAGIKDEYEKHAVELLGTQNKKAVDLKETQKNKALGLRNSQKIVAIKLRESEQ